MPVVGQKVERLIPFWTSPCGSHVLHLGDVRTVLRQLPAKSVHCVTTSPPYFGLRKYSIGDEGHQEIGAEEIPDCLGWANGNRCGVCFVCTLVAVFREVRRVLRDDGILWLNLGDSFSSGASGQNGTGSTTMSSADKGANNRGSRPPVKGFAPGNLIGVPWRVALALQADGWILRSDIPWIKRSSMPESVQNRPCKSLEYVFMLTKSANGYFFDMEVVRKKPISPERSREKNNGESAVDTKERSNGSCCGTDSSGRNMRNSDLWYESINSPHGLTGIDDELVGLDVTTKGYPGSHYAVFNENLIRPLILASTSARGCCSKCGRQWLRIVNKESINPWSERSANGAGGGSKQRGLNENHGDGLSQACGTTNNTVAWMRTCSCKNSEVIPCTVLDPFCGSGTTNATCVKHGRRSIGIDLSEQYLLENAVPRIEAAIFQGPDIVVLSPDMISDDNYQAKAITGGQRIRIK